MNDKIWPRAQSCTFNPIDQGAIMPHRHEMMVCAHLDDSRDNLNQQNDTLQPSDIN